MMRLSRATVRGHAGGILANSLYHTGGSHLGCFLDEDLGCCSATLAGTPTDRTVTYGLLQGVPDLTLEMCNAAALNAGFSIFGVQNGTCE